MKSNYLKVIALILVILTICLISFVGIYAQKLNKVENIVPEYLSTLDIKGTRLLEMTPNLSTKEVEDKTQHVHSEGEEHSEDEEIPTIEVPINTPDVLTKENYIICKNILENRLNAIGTNYYNIRLDEETGNTVIELAETTETDYIIRNLLNAGKFTVIDSDTEEVLLDNSNIQDCKAMYATTDTGTAVYIKFIFNKQSKSKLEQISKDYIQTTDEEGNTTQKNISVIIDDITLAETYFGETISNGELSITVKSGITTDAVFQEYLKEAMILSNMIKSGKMPVEYELTNIEYIQSDITTNKLIISICIGIAIFTLFLVYLIIRYRELGILATVSFIGFIAIFILIIRLTNVQLTLLGLLGILLILLLNYIFSLILLNNIYKNCNDKKIKEINVVTGFNTTLTKFLFIAIPTIFISIALCFIAWIPLQSLGMVMFWGLFLIFVYNYLITRNLIKYSANSIDKYEFKKIKLKTNVNSKIYKSVIVLILLIIILPGIAIAAFKGFNIGLEYSQSNRIKVNLSTDINIQDIKDITNQVFKDKQTIIQKVEFFNDTISINVSEITDEEKAEFIQKINDKYNLDYTTDNLAVKSMPSVKLIEVIKQYFIPFIYINLIICIYLCIRYKALGIFKVLLSSILIPIISLIVYINILSVTRLPINKLSILLGIIVNILAIIIITFILENEKSKIRKIKKK